tara:strand:+ start:299 stop:802 length:504 start_codon:yes stop_codon:yes gene_type:complete
MITKENLISAYFIDNERQNIEVITTSEDGKKAVPTIIPFDENNHMFKELMSIITLDQLHEDTYQKKKEEKKEFEKMALRIAKKSGLVFDEHKLDTKFYPVLVKAIFEDKENEDHLFALKLALFELEGIRNSKDEEKKRELRQSKNKIEVLKIAIDIISPPTDTSLLQ